MNAITAKPVPPTPLARAFKRLIAAGYLTLRGIPASYRPGARTVSAAASPLMLGGLYATLIPASTTRHVAYHNKSRNNQAGHFLTNIVSPYRKPVFQSQIDDIDLRIFVDAHSEFDRDWEVPG